MKSEIDKILHYFKICQMKRNNGSVNSRIKVPVAEKDIQCHLKK